MYALVTEEYRAGERQANTAHSRSAGSGSPPTWFTLIAANPIFENTEGGALPSTIERVSNYTPLNTSMFDGNLSPSDNNLQAAMDTIDNLVLGGTPPPVREILTSDRDYYVRTDGNDANSGLVNSAGGAFLTIQKAINVAAALDLSIYNVVIHVGDGTYNSAAIQLKTCVGAGSVTIRGNNTTWANVVVNQNSGADNLGNFNANYVFTAYYLEGMKLSAATVVNPRGIYCQAAKVYFKNIDFGAGFYDHIRPEFGGFVYATGDWKISAGATHHINTSAGGQFYGAGHTITLTGTPAFTNFVYADAISIIIAHANTWSGGATGQRYLVNMNSLIFTNAGGPNYFPGNSAGGFATGGQYV
jgi:hypothetical protein